MYRNPFVITQIRRSSSAGMINRTVTVTFLNQVMAVFTQIRFNIVNYIIAKHTYTTVTSLCLGVHNITESISQPKHLTYSNYNAKQHIFIPNKALLKNIFELSHLH